MAASLQGCGQVTLCARTAICRPNASSNFLFKVDAAAGGLRCRRCTLVLTPERLESGCAGVAASGASLARIFTRGRRADRRSLQVPSLITGCLTVAGCACTCHSVFV